MKPASMCTLISLLTLPLLLACGTESGKLPSAPEARIAAQQVRSDAPQFSDWSTPVNLGPVVNSSAGELEVAISKNGRSLYFSSDRPGGFGGFDIWVSQRRNVRDPWGPPQNLGSTINTAAREQAPALSPDGHQLYIFSDRTGGFGGTDIYVSRRDSKRDDFAWRAPENVGSGVNTSFNDQLPSYFEDDETETVTLFFNSNRPNGIGGTDIYASTRQPDGTFGPAVMVRELSSPLQDAGMAIRRDGLEIIFASNRSGSIPADRPGAIAFDLWVATRASTSDAWSVPSNLGPIVNTAGGESRVAMSSDGTTLYIISDREIRGNLDIYIATRSKLTHNDHADDSDDDDDDDSDHRRTRHRRR